MENDFRFAPGTPVVRLHQGDAAVAVAGAGQGDMAVAFSVMIGEEAGVGRAGMPARGVIDLPVVAVGGPGQARGALAVLVDGEDRQLEAAFGRAFIEEDRAGGGQALPVEDLVGTHTRRQRNGCGQVRALPVDTVLAFGSQKPLVLAIDSPRHRLAAQVKHAPQFAMFVVEHGWIAERVFGGVGVGGIPHPFGLPQAAGDVVTAGQTPVIKEEEGAQGHEIDP